MEHESLVLVRGPQGSSTWELVRIADLRPHPTSLNQHVHFKQAPLGNHIHTMSEKSWVGGFHLEKMALLAFCLLPQQMTTNFVASGDPLLSPDSVVSSRGPVGLCWALLWSLSGKFGFQNSFPSPVFPTTPFIFKRARVYLQSSCFRLPGLHHALWIIQLIGNLIFKVPLAT